MDSSSPMKVEGPNLYLFIFGNMFKKNRNHFYEAEQFPQQDGFARVPDLI